MNEAQNNIGEKFETGNTYLMTFIGDSDLKVPFICIGRTAKMASFQNAKRPNDEVLKRRIKEYGNSEYVLEGNYSMAPSIVAKRVIA